tara:strand:+ start:3966 stop:4241 length:276 start_codon:yes stop_codon:yes gene_type:complete
MLQRYDFPCVRIVWVDSCEPADNAELEYPAELPEIQRIIQVGHLVEETEDSVTVSGGWKPDLGTLDYTICIPKQSIISTRILCKVDDGREE